MLMAAAERSAPGLEMSINLSALGSSTRRIAAHLPIRFQQPAKRGFPDFPRPSLGDTQGKKRLPAPIGWTGSDFRTACNSPASFSMAAWSIWSQTWAAAWKNFSV